MIYTIQEKQFAGHVWLRVMKRSFFLIAIVIFLAFPVGTAGSYETIKTISLSPVQRSSFAMTDLCLPLLKSSSNAPSPVMDGNQRSAGKAAALSLFFGVRIVVGPLENTGFGHLQTSRTDSLNADAKDENRAFTVAAYRKCEKEQALRKIANTEPASE